MYLHGVNFQVEFNHEHYSSNIRGVGGVTVRGLPLITYASRGGGGVNTNAYKCVQGGRGGLNMTKNTHSVRSLIENATKSL